MPNLSRAIRYHATRTPDRVAVRFEGESVTYAALWQRCVAVAGMLRGRDIEPGDRVALLMKNSAAFIEVTLAISHIGAVAVPINFRLSPAEVDHILRDSGAALLLADDELADWAADVAAVVTLDAAARADASRLTGCAPSPDIAARNGSDLLRIMYTSGTTDHPKGVMLSHANIHAKSADQIVVLGLGEATRLLVCGPLYHVGACDLPGMAVLWAGGMLAVLREFDAGAALDLIAAERLTGAWLAPVMSSAMLADQQARARDVASLEWVIGGGERTPEARIRAWGEAFAGSRYIDAYGLTETCGGDTLMEAGREIDRIGSVGRPLPHVDVEIRDDSGNAVAAGVEGEVCVRGEKVTRGYWNAPEKTAASFFGDWLRTGDVGYLDDEGFLFLTDRKKDMILSGGENIASSEVERVIQAMPGVMDVAVVAVPDAKWGERPVAFVAGDVREDAVRAHCRAHLAGFKVPDRVVLVESLPRSASGKVLKRVLRDGIAR
ncbi:MAG: AMP-binding protein [Sphingomonadales bacterium]|nr:AMP-binding protein [Sphingomonadales bacterium]